MSYYESREACCQEDSVCCPSEGEGLLAVIAKNCFCSFLYSACHECADAFTDLLRSANNVVVCRCIEISRHSMRKPFLWSASFAAVTFLGHDQILAVFTTTG